MWCGLLVQANKKALEDLAAAFQQLEDHLVSRTYLVGQRLSLADIIVASQLHAPLQQSLDGAFRAKYPATLRWYSHVMALPAAAGVVGVVKFCKKAPAPPKKAKKEKKKKQGGGGGGGGGGGKKQEKAPAPAPKKKEKKAKNPLDLLPKSAFVLDDWKRTYSNSTTDYFKSMVYFWEKFDAEGWSIWHQAFNHDDENVRDFIVCNKMEGYVQRTIGIQKYCFGVMQMLDSMAAKGYYTVAGIWLIRGQDIKPMIETNPESGVYTWTRLDPTAEADRKRIAQYWCGEKDIDGFDCYDAKVFK